MFTDPTEPVDSMDSVVRQLTKAAGIAKRISPHSLRHRSITAALDAGVPLRDVQDTASHSDPRTPAPADDQP